MGLLTDPFLLFPDATSVAVAWFTETAGDEHAVLVGDRRIPATTRQLTRVAEDADSEVPDPPAGIVARAVFRHEARVDGLEPGARVPYRVVSDGVESAMFTLRGALGPGEPGTVLLTSDHQLMPNTAANIELAARTIGPIDAVFLAGDLVNVPDRASEWFDDARGNAFFPVLQGRAKRAGTDGVVYRGAPLLQHAPLYPAIGNHEVQGRPAASLQESFASPAPGAFSVDTYREILGAEPWYAVTVGDVRLISLFVTRVWRGTDADPDPAARTRTSRFQEAAHTLDDPGHGEFPFADVSAGSPQLRWLAAELASAERHAARFTIVMLHEGPHGLGGNVMAPFVAPQRIEERDGDGVLVGIRYDYPGPSLHADLVALVEGERVDLVFSGHSHLWNRFRSPAGVHYLETSNTGNTYGAFHPLSGRHRPGPPAPWDPAHHLAQGDPGGLDPVVPTEHPGGAPFVADDDIVVFTALDTGTGEITSWSADLRDDRGPVLLDRFRL